MKATFNMWSKRLGALSRLGPPLKRIWNGISKAVAKFWRDYNEEIFNTLVIGTIFIIVFGFLAWFISVVHSDSEKRRLPAEMEIMKPHLESNQCYKQFVDAVFAKESRVTIRDHERALSVCDVDTVTIIDSQKQYFGGK